MKKPPMLVIKITHFCYRNPLKELFLTHNDEPYFGPDECIDDLVMRKYLNNATVSDVYSCVLMALALLCWCVQVREAIHVESMSVTGEWRECTQNINYVTTVNSLLPIYPTLM